MPVDPATVEAASGAASSRGGINLGPSQGILRDVVNYKLTQRLNEQAWEREQQMYAQEIADKERFWRMQNTYNDPSQQMNRLRQAGLNPNLVYGKGADNTASSVASTSHRTPQLMGFQAQADPVGDIAKYQQIKKQQSEIQGIDIQNQIAKQIWWQQYYKTELEADKFGVRRGIITGAPGSEDTQFGKWIAAEIAATQKPVMDLQTMLQSYNFNENMMPLEKIQQELENELMRLEKLQREYETSTNETRKQLLANEVEASNYNVQSLRAMANWAEFNNNPFMKLLMGMLGQAGGAAVGGMMPQPAPPVRHSTQRSDVYHHRVP